MPTAAPPPSAAIDYAALAQAPRLLMECELKPLQGDRFQPTGFADLGPARYTAPRRPHGWTKENGDPNSWEQVEMLLVESAQSVANRLEAAIWDDATDDLIPELKGLPYILVKQGDRRLTNSILEAHRINSEYIQPENGEFRKTFIEAIGVSKEQPIDRKKLHAALFRFDPGSLLHGCFLEEIDGRLRVTRAVSGFVEATGVMEVASGGVKNNHVQPTLKDGKGNVPFHRAEFVAASVKAYFNLDLALLRGYGLPDEANRLLIALSLFKIQEFLRTGLRLRTACDLEPADGGLKTKRPDAFVIPGEDALLDECRTLVGACKAHFASPAVTTVEWKEPPKKKDGKKGKDTENEEDADEGNS